MAALAIIEGVGNMPGIAWLEATDAIGDNEAVGKVTLDSFCNFSDPWFSLNNGKGPPLFSVAALPICSRKYRWGVAVIVADDIKESILILLVFPLMFSPIGIGE